jgi:hypothetical protein
MLPNKRRPSLRWEWGGIARYFYRFEHQRRRERVFRDITYVSDASS